MLKRCRDDIDLGEYLYKQFKVIKRPQGMLLSNCPAATYTATCLLEHESESVECWMSREGFELLGAEDDSLQIENL
jgi:hypothetical protein